MLRLVRPVFFSGLLHSIVVTLLQVEYFLSIFFWPSLPMDFLVSLVGSSSVLFAFYYATLAFSWSGFGGCPRLGARFSMLKNELIGKKKKKVNIRKSTSAIHCIIMSRGEKNPMIISIGTEKAYD